MFVDFRNKNCQSSILYSECNFNLIYESIEFVHV